MNLKGERIYLGHHYSIFPTQQCHLKAKLQTFCHTQISKLEAVGFYESQGQGEQCLIDMGLVSVDNPGQLRTILSSI